MVINYEENEDSYYENMDDIAKVQEIRKIIDDELTEIAKKLPIIRLEKGEEFRGGFAIGQEWIDFLEENSEEIFSILIDDWTKNGWKLLLWDGSKAASKVRGELYYQDGVNVKYLLSKYDFDRRKTGPTILVTDIDE